MANKLFSIDKPLYTVPYFFREVVEIIERLTINGEHLDFKCTKGAGVGDYSSRGKGREK